ncbi:MAG: OmpA family protein [Polyangiaceae bacterium]|nr:OmpA family protein [Myxococcales bacterium]MCB9584094.1 OmpA family protein [Polyangiaceae bacterium]
MKHLLLATTLGLFAMACGSDPHPAVAPSGATQGDAQSSVAGPKASGDDESAPTQLAIDDKILKACGIASSEAHFDFNSANVKQGDYPVLTKLANCFSTGPLKGKQMLLVGHADSRGDEEYNMTLGGRRAGGVKSVLVARKLSGKQVTTSSRGELDATGSDESSYAADRRVDVRLAD